MKRNCLNDIHRLKQDAIRINSRSRVPLAICAHRKNLQILRVSSEINRVFSSPYTLILLVRNNQHLVVLSAAANSPTQAP